MTETRKITKPSEIEKILIMLKDTNPFWICDNGDNPNCEADNKGKPELKPEILACTIGEENQDCNSYCALYFWSKPYQLGEIRITNSAIRIIRHSPSLHGTIIIQELA